MEIRQQSFNFPKTSSSGPQPAEARIAFPRSILRATAGMSGYSATFENQEDHHLGRLTVELSSRIDPDDDTVLIVNGSFGLRDWSGEWDDDYSGNIQYVVLADLAGVSPPFPGDPRGDLIIVDGEITQVIQHFRSDDHLDSVNVFPDNSIRLVADKPTVVRLYIDYDASSGLAPIARLTGMLDVTTAAGTTTAISPIETIVPRRDVQIERGQRGHTLNFLIPEDLSRGVVAISARAIDAADNTQFSAAFIRTLTFETMPALPVIAVAINYTGPDVVDGATPAQLAAPTQADFVSTLQLTERLFPIPQVSITSFLTMDYDEEVESDISEGCDKLDELLDAVRDMRGDSEDIVLGLFNTGLNTGSVGGCGGGGAAVGRVNAGGTAAHELGHALGRQHAPCDNVTRCNQPANTDDNYPRYSGYDSDSIGEFGFDSFNLSVKDPAIAHDIMGYSGNKWISPYNYKALMSRLPEEFGAAAGGPEGRPEDRGDWIKIKQQQLFLNLRIERDHSIELRPAFHFAAFPQPRGMLRTEFTIELQDERGRMLKHACLYASAHGSSCGCGHGTWPLRIRQALSFDRCAASLVIFDCDGKVVFRREIGAPPKVAVEVDGADDPSRKELTVRWQADDGEALWYLVQWRDARGTWRGAGPRTRAMSMQVPKTLFRRQREVAVRVLASGGIATGESVWEGRLGVPDQAPGANIGLSLAGVAAGAGGSVPLPPLLRLVMSNGPVRPDVRWYNSRGAEIGRGRTLELNRLPPGMHAVHAVVLDTGQGGATAVWTVEHQRSGRFVLHLPKRSDQSATTKE